MKIIVNELKKAQGQRQRLEGSVNTEGMEIPQVQFERFSLNGLACIDGEFVQVEGEISGRILTACARCAASTSYRFQAPFEERFSEGPIDDEEEINPFQSGKIDLAPYLRQTIMLNMPQVYICSDECKGLCPSCGTNWNEQSCSCDNERIDPRLADLALFFKKD